ncbi:hypothetical protein LY76DRAFT_73358 [Colletotrichum caudatum]|nr:hypothetical protein LY76DRAFT_73358 [Colletotrichum caudatum]
MSHRYAMPTNLSSCPIQNPPTPPLPALPLSLSEPRHPSIARGPSHLISSSLPGIPREYVASCKAPGLIPREASAALVAQLDARLSVGGWASFPSIPCCVHTHVFADYPPSGLDRQGPWPACCCAGANQPVVHLVRWCAVLCCGVRRARVCAFLVLVSSLLCSMRVDVV